MKFSTVCLKSLFCLLSTLFVVITVPATYAQTNYYVGPGQAYADLEALRIDGIIWKNGDTITLHGDDNSLEGPFNFGDNINVTIQGYGKITPGTASLFHPVGGHQDRTITILPDAGKTLTFEGFDAGSQNGGVIDGLGGNSFIILDGAGGGTINFVNNHVDVGRGGAIYADTIEILDGMNSFTNNSANDYGGAIGANTAVTFSGGTNLFINNKAKDGGAIWGNTISSIITFTGGTNTFIDNKANNNGGAIYADTIDIRDGTNSFANNSADNNGGAIWGNTAVTLSGGTNSFANNSANKYGGAIYAANTVKLSDGMNTFTNNSADSRGGAISGSIVEISNGTNTFTNNSADGLNPTDGLGGAISGDTVTLSGGTNSFINNSASNDGGAIFSFGSITLSGGTNSFINNLATGYGGAIGANTDVTLFGGTNSFINNSATGDGGAILAGGKVTLIADGGDITFRGNTHQSGTSNAIYMYNIGGNNTLTLAAEAGRSILFYDPIESGSTWQNLTVNINDGPLYTGTVQFDTHRSEVYGDTTVHGGTMQLTGGATYSNTSTILGRGTFTLNGGATLLSDVRGNTVQANTIKLETGSTLAFDMINATISTTNLALNGNIDSTGQKVGEGNIDINTLYSLKAGQYTLVKTDDENYVSDPPAIPNVDQAGNAGFFLERSGQNDEYLVLNITSAARYTALPGFRPNSYNVADALDRMTDLVIRSEATNILARLGDNSVGLINQIPGDIFANAPFVAVDLRKEFNAILPTHRNILNERVTPPSYVYYGQNPDNWTGHYARYYKKKLSGMWATPTGRYVGRNSHAGYYGYDLGNAGVALGKSWQLNDKRMIGIAFGYEYARIEMQGVPQKDDMQSFDFALYGGSRKLCGCFTDWHIGYGKNWHDTNRIVAGAKTQSNYDDNVFSFGITTGRHVGLWTPSIGIEMVQVWSPSHTESGSSPFLLHVNRDNYTSIELPVGTRLTKTFSIASREMTLTPELRAFWVPQLGDQSSSMTTSFASGSTNFIVDSGDFGWQHGRFGTGLTTQLSESLSAAVNYDATIYSGQTRQIASVSLMARF